MLQLASCFLLLLLLSLHMLPLHFCHLTTDDVTKFPPLTLSILFSLFSSCSRSSSCRSTRRRLPSSAAPFTLRPSMDCIEVSTEGGRESGDMVNLIILSMIHESLLFRFNPFLILGSTSSIRAEMSSMRSGGVTPD